MKINPKSVLDAAIDAAGFAWAAGDRLTFLARQSAALVLLDAAGKVAMNAYRGETHDGSPDGPVSGRLVIVAPTFADLVLLSAAGADGLMSRSRERFDAALAEATAEATAGLDDLLAAVVAEQAKSDGEGEQG